MIINRQYIHSAVLFFFVAFSVLLVSSCSVVSSPPDRTEVNHELVREIEESPKRSNKLRIEIFISTQMGQLLRGNQIVAVFPVSTGMVGHSTPFGDFSIYNKEKNNRSSLYGSIYDAQGNKIIRYADSRKDRIPRGGWFEGAEMPYTMHFTGYCAFHEGLVPYPPQKTSHGCIHLTPDIAALLFRICPVGTPVFIRN